MRTLSKVITATAFSALLGAGAVTLGAGPAAAQRSHMGMRAHSNARGFNRGVHSGFNRGFRTGFRQGFHGGRTWHHGFWRGGHWFGGWWGPTIAIGVGYPYYGYGYGPYYASYPAYCYDPYSPYYYSAYCGY